MSHQQLIVQHLTLEGDGTGNSNFANDYSTGVVRPRVLPAGNEVIELHTLSLYIEDAGQFRAHRFANRPALPNGMGVQVASGDDIIVDLLAQEPVKTNGGILHYATRWTEIAGTPRAFTATWEFNKTFGQPFRLHGRNLEELRVTLNDNFVPLSTMEFIAFGHRINDVSSPLSF